MDSYICILSISCEIALTDECHIRIEDFID